MMENNYDERLKKCEMYIKKLAEYVDMPMDEDYSEKEGKEYKKEDEGKPSIAILMKKKEL